jgi:hypothetical protein
MNLSQIQIPPLVAAWVDRVVFVLVTLILVWVVLELVGYFMRRAYNLTPVGTAKSKNVRPDFLKVDHSARDEMVRKGKQFDVAQMAGVGKAATAISIGAGISGCLSFVIAAFLALGNIQGYEETWNKFSSPEKFLAIVQNHPYGFFIAVVVVIASFLRLLPMIRGNKVAAV